MNTTRVIQKREENYSRYVQNPITKTEDSGQLIEGSFYQAKPMTVREMFTRRINKSLCCGLIATIMVTFVSYYIAMVYEAKLNTLDNEIVRLNMENQDLEAELDRFRSFTNVDNKINQFNLLQKPDKVIEVTAMTTQEHPITTTHKISSDDVNWAIGY